MPAARLRVISRYALGAVRTQRAVARVEPLFHASIRYAGPTYGAVRASVYRVARDHYTSLPRARPSTAPTYAIAERRSRPAAAGAGTRVVPLPTLGLLYPRRADRGTCS